MGAVLYYFASASFVTGGVVKRLFEIAVFDNSFKQISIPFHGLFLRF